MKTAFAISATTLIWVTILVGAAVPREVELKETFYFSRSCPSGHWYLEKVDEAKVTMFCDYDDGDGR